MAACRIAKLRVACTVAGCVPGVRTMTRSDRFHAITELSVCGAVSAGTVEKWEARREARRSIFLMDQISFRRLRAHSLKPGTPSRNGFSRAHEPMHAVRRTASDFDGLPQSFRTGNGPHLSKLGAPRNIPR